MKTYLTDDAGSSFAETDQWSADWPDRALYDDTSDWSKRCRQVLSPKMRHYSPAVKWAGSKALLVQCESGLVADGLVRRGCDVTAVDTRRGMLELARMRSMANGYLVRYRPAEQLSKLPFDGESFDIVQFDHVFERARDLPDLLGEAYRLLKPGGAVLFATVNASLRSRIAAGVLPRLLLPGFPPSVRRLHPYGPAAMRRALKKAGFEVETFAGLRVRPFSLLRSPAYKITKGPSRIYLGVGLKP